MSDEFSFFIISYSYPFMIQSDVCLTGSFCIPKSYILIPQFGIFTLLMTKDSFSIHNSAQFSIANTAYCMKEKADMAEATKKVPGNGVVMPFPGTYPYHSALAYYQSNCCCEIMM